MVSTVLDFVTVPYPLTGARTKQRCVERFLETLRQRAAKRHLQAPGYDLLSHLVLVWHAGMISPCRRGPDSRGKMREGGRNRSLHSRPPIRL
jgi:hypothetical protein